MSTDTPPKIVLFDLGKVLVDFEWITAANRIAPRSKFAAPELMDKMLRSPILPRYERGLLSTAEFFDEIRRAIDYRGSFEEFAEGFANIFSEVPAMVGLQARVRAAGVPTYIFSNTNDLAVSHIRRAFPFFSNFDGYFLSYELHQMKPEPGIYEEAERVTGCRGAEILYLDDFPANTNGGAIRGWQTILHTSAEETVPRVEGLLQPRLS
jgi:glucose-1-phosphatase